MDEHSLMNRFGKLRSVADHEVACMREWRNMPAVRKNMYTRHEISAEEHAQWWARTSARADQAYAMYENAAGRACGVVGMTQIDRTHLNCSWAFYTAPEAPRGTGSCMEFLAIERAFLDWGMHKLCCEVLDFNTPVIKMHRKFGFQIEGVLRQQHQVDGTFHDIYRMGLLASEWRGGCRAAMLERLLSLQ